MITLYYLRFLNWRIKRRIASNERFNAKVRARIAKYGDVS